MKTPKKIFMALATIGLLGACSNTEVVETGSAIDENAVSFSSNIMLDSPFSRVTDNKWDKNDAIGVFAIESGQELSDVTLFDGKANIKHTTQEAGITAKFTAESNAIELKQGDKVDVVAYYPYATAITDYKLPISVKDQSDLSKIDVLYSNDLKALADNGEARMNFAHQLSQVIFRVEPGNGYPNVDQVKFGALKGLKTEGFMSLKDGIISLDKGESSDIALTVTGSNARAIVLPGQELSGQVSMTLTLGEDEFIWTPRTTLAALESGKKYTFRLQLSADGSVKTLNPEADIEDWTEGNANGDIDVVTPGGSLDPDPQPEPNESLTIAELKNKFSNATFEKPIFIDQDLKIRGIVMSDDSQGNISNKLYIQDKTAAITLFVKKADLYKSFSVGQEIEVDIQGFYVSVFGDVLQISHAIEENGTWKGQPIEWDSIKDKIEVQGDDLKPITPKSIGFSDLDTDLINTLVRLEGVSFKETGLTYVEGGRDTDRTVVFSDGNEIKLRSKSSAKFANEVLPAGTGSITAFLDYFRGTYQLTIRDLSDVVFEDSDSDGDGSEDPGLETGSVVLLSDDFQITQKSQQLTVYSKNLQESGALKLMPNFSYSKEDSKVKIEVRSAEGGCIWLPAKKVGSLYLNNIPVKDLKELQVKLQMQCLNNDKVNASDLKVYVGEAEVSLAPNDPLTKDYKDFTLNLEKDLFTQDEITVKIIIDNLADGVRIGKLEIVGVK